MELTTTLNKEQMDALRSIDGVLKKYGCGRNYYFSPASRRERDSGDKDLSEYCAALQKLLPDFIPSTGGIAFLLERKGDGYIKNMREIPGITPWNSDDNLAGNTLTLLIQNIDKQECESDTLILQESEIYLAIAYAPCGIADDLATRLFKTHKPKLFGITKLPKWTDQDQGFEDVREFPEIVKLYKKTQALIRNSRNLTGISKDELEILREDSLRHKNIAIRRISKQQYDNELEALARYA